MGEVRTALEQPSTKPADQRAVDRRAAVREHERDTENEYFSDGMAEEIINALAQIPGLKVIARTSAFAFKGKHEDIRRIAEALGVDHILEGSVRKAGQSHPRHGAADHRRRRSSSLVRALRPRARRCLRDPGRDRAPSPRPSSQADGNIHQAHPQSALPTRHYFEAAIIGKSSRQRSLARAQESFEQAIALDPEHAAPHAELGLTYFLSTTTGTGWQPHHDRMRRSYSS